MFHSLGGATVATRVTVQMHPLLIRDLADLHKHSWRLLKCTCDTFGRMLEATTYSPSSSYVMIHVILCSDIVLGGVLNQGC